jgi:hypothetical protein
MPFNPFGLANNQDLCFKLSIFPNEHPFPYLDAISQLESQEKQEGRHANESIHQKTPDR